MDAGVGDNNIVACVVKLRHPWEGSQKKVLKSLHKIKGVHAAEIDNDGNLHISVDADAVPAVVRKLKKFVESPEVPRGVNGDVKFNRGFLKSLFRRKEKTAVVAVDGEDNNVKVAGKGILILFWCVCIGVILLVVWLTI